MDPAKRIRTPTTDRRELDSEGALLLDPAKPGDVAVLTFDSDGTTKIHPSKAGNSVDLRRFEASRIHYHLDWWAFKDRRTEIYNEVERAVHRGLGCAPVQEASSLDWPQEFEYVLRDLLSMMDRKRDFSSAAIAYIRSFRNIWWIQDVVLALAPRT